MRTLSQKQLNDVDRCPHCGIAKPHLVQLWSSGQAVPRQDGGLPRKWACYSCTSCGFLTLAAGYEASAPWHSVDQIEAFFPRIQTAHTDIPSVARTYLQQAYDTRHAPDAAAVMAGSAVDAMLKEKGYSNGSLYDRIDQALKDNLLTQGMAEWAHEVRLGSNRPRHADLEHPHVSPEEAKQSVEFAEALGNFLYVLTARVTRGLAAAKQAGTVTPPAV
ncbi:DUF4145 domain-containing protein [Brevundimonas nasdae]|uniref:DUF4145 domain-containing protein n=1 Tax=Brevundimonas nasdae TaxID=172043 RepID=UPI003F694399